MLHTKELAVGQIVVVRLASGEEVVGRLHSGSIAAYELSRPMLATANPFGGYPTYTPFVHSAPDANVRILKASLITEPVALTADRASAYEASIAYRDAQARS